MAGRAAAMVVKPAVPRAAALGDVVAAVVGELFVAAMAAEELVATEMGEEAHIPKYLGAGWEVQQRHESRAARCSARADSTLADAARCHSRDVR